MTARRPTLHVLGTGSLMTWLPHFGPVGDEFVEAPPLLGRVELLELLDSYAGRDVEMHSGHASLVRDAWVGARRRAQGHPVSSQSLRAASLGLNKVEMRRCLAGAGLQVTPGASEGDGPVVMKPISGTAGEAIHLERDRSGLCPGEFAEMFVHGSELSLNVYVVGTRVVTFPPVWKGTTRYDLVPPYRRVRECPLPEHFEEVEGRLRRDAIAAARACAVTGYAEVEFVFGTDGVLYVLEVNPRISGTLRLSAMAATAPILGLGTVEADLHLPAVRFGAECPFNGRPFCDLARGSVATSRLTVVADSRDAALRSLARHADTAPNGELVP